MHPDTYKRPLLLTLIVLILGLCFFYRSAPNKQDVFHMISKEEVTLVGRVENFAVPKKDSHNTVVQIISVNGKPCGGRVYARFTGKAAQWKDVISFRGVLQKPYGIDLPGQFNWPRYLALQHVFTEVKSNEFTVVKRAGPFWRLVRALRHSILRTFAQAFPPDLAAVAGGILLGERGEISPALYTAFQDSGAIHLLVASGGNVGFVTLLTLLVGSWLGFRRRLLLVFALGTAGIYTLVAGADAPLVRAYFMAVGACAGYFLERNSGVFQGLLLSCFVILLFNPAAVFDTGFEMSFLATWAIILCLTAYRPPKNWPRPVKFFAQIFLATLASQLALLPVFTNVFYKVSVMGLAANMVLVPFASLLMALTFAYYVASLLHIGLAVYFPCAGGLEVFKMLVEFFASAKFASVPVTAWNAGTIAAYYTLLFLVFNLPNKNFARKIAIPCVAVAAFAFACGAYVCGKDRVYLLSEWDHRAALVRANGKTFVFTSRLPQEKMDRALAALGLPPPTAVFALDTETAVTPGGILPFAEIWPGNGMTFDDVRVQAVWEIHQAKDGHLWSEPGYSGRKGEGISYCVHAKNDTLCIGQQARFAQRNQSEITLGETNKTISAKW